MSLSIYYLEYGRQVVRLRRHRRRRRAYTPYMYTASHDNNEEINSWVSFSFPYEYGAPLGGPLGRRTPAIIYKALGSKFHRKGKGGTIEAEENNQCVRNGRSLRGCEMIKNNSYKMGNYLIIVSPYAGAKIPFQKRFILLSFSVSIIWDNVTKVIFNEPLVRCVIRIRDRSSKVRVKTWSQDWLIAAGAYPGFCSMKQLGVFLLPPGRDASQVTSLLSSQVFFSSQVTTPGWRDPKMNFTVSSSDDEQLVDPLSVQISLLHL